MGYPNLFPRYSTDRLPYVIFSCVMFSAFVTLSGFLQGAVLGLLFYDNFINYLCYVLNYSICLSVKLLNYIVNICF
jgi:hypothetical protein